MYYIIITYSKIQSDIFSIYKLFSFSLDKK